MKTFRWSRAKNEKLKTERGITFEEVLMAIEGQGLLDVLEHSNRAKYPKQRVMVIAVAGYAYLVPFVEESDCYFLKTVIPSRKATRDYLSHGDADAQT